MAYYDGPPGMTIDLIPPSPDGVDVVYDHPYADANPYRYGVNNPVKWVDPSGEFPCTPPAWARVAIKCAKWAIQNRKDLSTLKMTCEMHFAGFEWTGTGCRPVYSVDYTCQAKPKRRGCTDAEKAALYAIVVALCKTDPGQGKRCHNLMTPAELLENAGKFRACQAARNEINRRCFNGNDKGHQQAADDAGRAAARCMRIAEEIGIGGGGGIL